MRTGCPFLAQKIMYALMKFNMWDTGIMVFWKLLMNIVLCSLTTFFFLCRSFIFSVHCCVYINILNTFLYFDYLYKNKTFKPVYDMDILYSFKVIWSVWDCTVSRGSFDCIVYTDFKKNIYNKFKWKVMYDSKRYCSSF